MWRMQRTTDARRGITLRMECEREPITSKSLPTPPAQEVAACREQIAAEAEAISRLCDKKGRMRSKRIFALAMASGC
jgi:hypothetical protein